MILMYLTIILVSFALGIYYRVTTQKEETLNRIDRLRRVVESKVTTLYVKHKQAETQDEKKNIEQILSKWFLRSSKLLEIRWEVKNRKKINI
ncbi:MAG: hypothetical protein MJZ34_08365 [Paludibacteraceae bacterium]|nr:hypothetical protein [Paludibacteraceae bacterium]